MFAGEASMIIMMTRLISMAGAVFVFWAASANAQMGTVTIASPDRQLEITFETVANKTITTNGGALFYYVTFRGAPLISSSSLKLTLEGQPPLGANVRITGAAVSEMDEFYHLVTGKTSAARNRCKTLRVELTETGETARHLTIEARAYNDAVAFRYVVPEQPGLNEFKLAKEQTEFHISKDPFIYALVLPHFRSMYESEYVKLSASSLANQGGVSSRVLLGLPLLMEVPGVAWMAITEADVRDYSAMYLVNTAGNWAGHTFESVLSPQLDNTNLCVTGALPHQSPWRVLQIASTPGELISSTILTSLNPPSTIKDTSWIHAGKAAWDWWCGSIGKDGKEAFTTDTMKFYADFASKSGFEYLLIDAGWSENDITKMNGRVDVPEVVRYASLKGVKTWIWISYGAARKQMDEAFPLYEKWGVAGVKIDFIERDDQEGIAFYHQAAKKAAEHHLMVDFHGCTKPSGLDRTYPNIMGYEAVLGMEQSKGGSRDNPENHVMLPFTRMLAGRMDYTPGAFDNVTKEQFTPRNEFPMVMGTRAHQLAMYVVYEAPFQMVSDYPKSYEKQPGFDFIKAVPTTWDETRVINGVPGQYIIIARRHGDDWYLGAMSNWQPRQLDIPLSFLGTGRYAAEIYADGKDADMAPKHLLIDKKTVRSSGHLTINLSQGGGCAIRFLLKK